MMYECICRVYTLYAWYVYVSMTGTYFKIKYKMKWRLWRLRRYRVCTIITKIKR